MREADPYAALLEGFHAHLTLQRGCSVHTARAYVADVRAVARRAQACGLAGPGAWTGSFLRAALAAAGKARGGPLGAGSLARRQSACRTFYAWWHAASGLPAGGDGGPTACLQAPRRGRALPRALEAEVTARLLRGAPRSMVPRGGPARDEHGDERLARGEHARSRHARGEHARGDYARGEPAHGDLPRASRRGELSGDAPGRQTPPRAPAPATALRDDAVLALLYGLGLRLSEAVGLRRDRVDLAGRRASLVGKGGRGRVVPIPAGAVAALAAYDATLPGARTPFLVGRGGRPLGARTVARIVARRAAATLGSHVTPHQLRHSYATDLLADGAGLRHIQALLGHRSLVATERYTAVSVERLFAAFDAAHPRASGRPGRS